MPLSQDDRKAFSLKIVSADQEAAAYLTAKSQASVEQAKMLKIDTANKNLFDPVSALINQYQQELTTLDGIVRSTFNESNIQDSALMKLQNYFYPNDTTVTVPSLVPNHNVWTKTKPYARTFAVGKNYVESYLGATQKEPDLISPVLALITSASSYTNTQLTTGKRVVSSGTCDNPMYTDQTSCVNNGGIWTPGPNVLENYAVVVQLKSDLVTAINALKTFLLTEVTYIVTTDPDNANQTQNNTAINNINNVIISAINAWLAYADFNATGVTVFNFNSIDPDTLAPTKLHSTELTALQTAINNRSSFVTTRISQVTTVLGSITQDLNTGDISASTGLYGKRYSFLNLRLDLLTGSLNKYVMSQQGTGAIDSIIASIKQNKITYNQVVPTTAFQANGNGTATIQVVDASFISAGDTVFIMAESQQELQRAVKSVTGTTLVLNDIVPAKYKTTDKLRLYKDIT